MRVVKITFMAMLMLLPLVVLGSHFPPPSSSFQPMSIYITKASLNDVDLVSGDEVGVFDASICAGVDVFDHTATRQNPSSLLAYKKDNGETGLAKAQR